MPAAKGSARTPLGPKEVTAFPCCSAPPAQRRSDQCLNIYSGKGFIFTKDSQESSKVAKRKEKGRSKKPQLTNVRKQRDIKDITQ